MAARPDRFECPASVSKRSEGELANPAPAEEKRNREGLLQSLIFDEK
jgi:hypothetical protein